MAVNVTYSPLRQSGSESNAQLHQSINRQFEQTIKTMHMKYPSPERPLQMGGILGVTQLAFQISPQTNVFIDPFMVTEFFQERL